MIRFLCPKQHKKIRWLLPILVIGTPVLLIAINPQYRAPFSNPFRYLFSPICLGSSPPAPPQEEPAGRRLPPENQLQSKKSATRGCDVYRGEWVQDPEALYYTNESCSMIQDNRNCLMFGRPNTEYLSWRWKPDGCELPRFDPNRFMEMMRGKAMAFVGDSLAKNHMQSLVCILSSVGYPRDMTEKGELDSKHMYYEKYNFNVSVLWTPFLVSTAVPPYRNMDGLWTLKLDEADGRWINLIAGFDYVIISDGTWFLKRSMVYEGGQLVGCQSCGIQDIPQISVQYINSKAFRTALAALNGLDKFKGTVILRTISPDHFENGKWDTGGDCVKTWPLRREEGYKNFLNPLATSIYKAQIKEFKAAERVGRRRGLEYKIIDSLHAMLLRPDGHPSRYSHWPRPNVTFRNDCVHWCMPGPVDVWNEFLYYTLF